MKNNRGQALVEFLLVIPVFMFILLGIIDVGNIIISKYKLENNLSTVVELYQNNQITELSNYVSQNDIVINYEKNEKYIEIILSDNVSIKTPGLNNILGKSMLIETSRTIYNE